MSEEQKTRGVSNMRTMPKRLQKGDTVGIISPSSPPNLENLKKALPFLEELGLKVKMGKSVEAKNGYLAGTDDERLADLHAMFERSEERRGGKECRARSSPGNYTRKCEP